MVTSAAAAASAGVSTIRARISPASGSELDRVRFWTITSWPARARARAIALPIRPVPATATVVMAALLRGLGPSMDGVDDAVHGRDRRLLEVGRRGQRQMGRGDP